VSKHPVPPEHGAPVGEVDRRHLDVPWLRDVLPDVELGSSPTTGTPRMCSPLRWRPLKSPHSSGRWFFGSHCTDDRPEGETRFLGPCLLLVTARPRPKTASKRMLGEWRRAASWSAGDCATGSGPGRPTTVRCPIDSWTEAILSWASSSATRRSRNSSTSGKLWPVSTCMTGKGSRAGQKAFSASQEHDHRVLAPGEQQHRTLELGHHLTHDVDGPVLECLEMRKLGTFARPPRVPP